MSIKRLFFTLLLALTLSSAARAEDEPRQIGYQTEMFASAASGSYTPFWMVSNRYGMVPLTAGNGYLSAGMFYRQRFGNGFRWSAGADLAAATPRYRNVFVRQLYAEMTYRSLAFVLGSKEENLSLWDKDLSSGDMVRSANARPIPEARISIPAYIPVPGTGKWLQFKGHFAVGRSFDTDYLTLFTRSSQAVFVKDVLWHYKSLFLRTASPEGGFPLSLELGVQHGAQWGGESTNPKIGKQPLSLADFARIVLGMGGGAGATASDRINVLGNHYGSYDFKLSWQGAHWTASAYHQRFFDDKSGMIFGNSWDGLWGIQLQLPGLPWLRKIVVESLDTRHQTGPMHFIEFDHSKHPGVGGGDDDYYNNIEYLAGLSHFGRSIGSPLLPSPEYNTDGDVLFKNTRVRDWHIGLSGELSPQWSYRMLLTLMDSWGRHAYPFLDNKTGVSGLLEVAWRPAGLAGWSFTGSVGVDAGVIFDRSLGFGLCVAKRGILPIGQKR
jgi:hypothetical protein